MRVKRLMLVFVLMFIWVGGNAYAAYEVDKDLLYEEKSKYLSSKWTLDLKAEGDDDGTTDKTEQTFKTDVGLKLVVEQSLLGYWANADLNVDYRKNDDGTTKSDETTIELKNFDYSSGGIFLGGAPADFGYKRYFSRQSPYFAFGQGLVNWKTIDSDATVAKGADGVEAAVGIGVGYGKIVDLGSYERVLIVQDELLSAGLIKVKFSRSIILELLPLFRRTREENDRLLKVQKILLDKGLIDKGVLTLHIASDIQDAIDESFEKRQYGLEIRASYLQEVSHYDSDQDKDGWLNAYAKYERPLTEKLQYTTQADLYQQVVTDADDKRTSFGWNNYLTGVINAQITYNTGHQRGYMVNWNMN